MLQRSVPGDSLKLDQCENDFGGLGENKKTALKVVPGSETRTQKKGRSTWNVQNPANNGINYQPQLVQGFFHQQYGSLGFIGLEVSIFGIVNFPNSKKQRLLKPWSGWIFSKSYFRSYGWVKQGGSVVSGRSTKGRFLKHGQLRCLRTKGEGIFCKLPN